MSPILLRTGIRCKYNNKWTKNIQALEYFTAKIWLAVISSLQTTFR